MYDQGMLSFMTRGLPATRHVARTLGTWQVTSETISTEAGDEAGRGERDHLLTRHQDTWPPSVRRAEGESFVTLSYCVFTPLSASCLSLSPSRSLSPPPRHPHPHRHRARHVARALGFHAPGDREHALGAFPGGQARSE